MKNHRQETPHLGPEDFFLLVLPPAGEPEPLPFHLSSCRDCARQLGEWQEAARSLADVEDEPPADFERNVMSRVRVSRVPHSHRGLRRLSVGLAATACLLMAFWVGMRVGTFAPEPVPPAASALDAADRADDALLRDVTRLVSGEEDSPWKTLAPLPEAAGGAS